MLHKFFDFDEPKITFDEINDKIYNTEPIALTEKKMFVMGFCLGDGTSGIYKFQSGIKYCWKLNNFRIIEKLQRYCKENWSGINFKILDIRESSHVYRIASGKKILALEFEEFHTESKKKRVPDYTLNETLEKRKWFFIGFYAAYGNRINKQKNISFSQKLKITMSG